MKVRSESVHIQVETVDNAATATLQLVVHAPRDVIDELEKVLLSDVYSVMQRSTFQPKTAATSNDSTVLRPELQTSEPHIFFPKVVPNGN